MIPRIRNILYATDLTRNSAYAFRWAVNSAQKHDARIHILHVLEKLSPGEETILSLHAYLPQLEEIRREKSDELMERIQKRLDEFARRELQDDAEMLNRLASIQVVDGDPAEEILQKADELNCDVIVMGTHGKGLITHTFLGSVSEKVLQRIRKPVFIIPIPKEDTDISFNDI